MATSLDYLQTALNPCSLESLSEPVEFDNGKSVWPVMLACYELQEDQKSRRGRLDLYAVPVPVPASCLSDNNENQDDSVLIKFGAPQTIIDSTIESSGILDGKWHPRGTAAAANDKWWYATAHSSGEIVVHSVAKSPTLEGDDNDNNPQTPFQVKLAGKSDIIMESSEDTAGLCLAVGWEQTTSSSVHSDFTTTRMISSYSNGKVAIHNLTTLADDSVHLVEEHSWLAHRMFKSPAEVWSACFVASDRNMVLSGGDEGNLKVWDIRGLSQPSLVLKQFEAGVTVLSPHPRQEHLVACGSYDETVAIYDVRYLSPQRKTPLCHSNPLGGGMWRIKWHPQDDNRLLLCAMHGGCRVVNVDGFAISTNEHADNNIVEGTSTPNIKVEKEFTEHKSMAYGADWLVCRHPKREGYFEAAASCSFYDRALYLWEAK
jgi:diphthamide biosynthesis protein 7